MACIYMGPDRALARWLRSVPPNKFKRNFHRKTTKGSKQTFPSPSAEQQENKAQVTDIPLGIRAVVGASGLKETVSVQPICTQPRAKQSHPHSALPHPGRKQMARVWRRPATPCPGTVAPFIDQHVYAYLILQYCGCRLVLALEAFCILYYFSQRVHTAQTLIQSLSLSPLPRERELFFMSQLDWNLIRRERELLRVECRERLDDN